MRLVRLRERSDRQCGTIRKGNCEITHCITGHDGGLLDQRQRRAGSSDLANTPAEPAVREVEEQVQQADEQVRQAQTQIKEVGKAWKAAAKAMRGAQVALAVEPPELPEDFEYQSEGFPGALAAVKDKLFTLAAPARVATKPLIVRGAQADPDIQADIEEDLTVMSRILNKVASERGAREEHDWAMGIALSSLGSGRRPQSIYLEGYGALFLMNVKFPLVAPPKKELADKKQDEASDSEWEQTKDELFGDRKVRRHGPVVQPFLGGEGPKMEYEAERVAELKKNILEALKNASNIRNVKPDESITVAVTGPDNGPGTQVRRVFRNDNHGPAAKSGRVERDVVTVMKADKALMGEETHLIIRVKKADADGFAKGKLTLEDFEKKASVVAY